jgi:PBP1b-binding outer membrane lipoprotein LpoB
MKRIGLLLILLSMFLAACSSGGTAVTEQVESEEPEATTAPPVTSEPVDETGNEAEADSGPIVSSEEPTLARERDWKLGNTETPAVTIIEYGDFQ